MKKLILVLTLCLLVFPALAKGAGKESAYDRVVRTGTIRCGYFVAEPYFMKDPLKGTLSGISYEYAEELGKWLGLNINWAEEVGLGDLATVLDSGRVDAMCVALWINPQRARVVDFVTPVTYQVIDAYVREDDSRFDGNMDDLNSPDVTISCIDGEMAGVIASEDFPKAKTLCLPQLAPFSDMLMNVSQGKADVTFTTQVALTGFNAANSPKLRKIKTEYPIRIFPEAFVVARGDDDFRRMLDHTTQFLVNSGKIEKILMKYSKSPEDFRRTIKPYEEQ